MSHLVLWETNMPDLNALSTLCTLLQITGGFLFVLFAFMRIPALLPLLAVSGFASVVKVFLPLAGHQSPLAYGLALTGIALIAFSIWWKK